MGRNETNFRDVTSKNGDFSPHIGKHTAERLTKFCKRTNRNRTRFVEQCINDRLEVLERELLNDMSKDELIELLLSSR